MQTDTHLDRLAGSWGLKVGTRHRPKCFPRLRKPAHIINITYITINLMFFHESPAKILFSALLLLLVWASDKIKLHTFTGYADLFRSQRNTTLQSNDHFFGNFISKQYLALIMLLSVKKMPQM
jgi:hypothetical protein